MDYIKSLKQGKKAKSRGEEKREDVKRGEDVKKVVEEESELSLKKPVSHKKLSPVRTTRRRRINSSSILDKLR